MINVIKIKKAIINKEIEFYIGGNRIFCRSDNGDTIQVLDLSEHDKQIRAEVIDECIAEINKTCNSREDAVVYPHTVCNILEMLKEQNK